MTPAQIIQAIEGMEPAMQRAYLEQVKAVVGAATVAEVERLIAEEDEEVCTSSYKYIMRM